MPSENSPESHGELSLVDVSDELSNVSTRLGGNLYNVTGGDGDRTTFFFPGSTAGATATAAATEVNGLSLTISSIFSALNEGAAAAAVATATAGVDTVIGAAVGEPTSVDALWRLGVVATSSISSCRYRFGLILRPLRLIISGSTCAVDGVAPLPAGATAVATGTGVNEAVSNLVFDGVLAFDGFF